MRRYFFKPRILKVSAAFLFTLFTFYKTKLEPLYADRIEEAKGFYDIGLELVYEAIGPDNPVLKFLVIGLFWFIVGWLVYFAVWFIEYIYVKIFNFIIIKRKFTK